MKTCLLGRQINHEEHMFTWKTDRRHLLPVSEVKRFARLDQRDVILVSFVLHVEEIVLLHRI